MSEVSYHGHVFSASGMSSDPEKIKAIQDWSSPKDVTTFRQFLGLASYYRCYIQNFADISAPLNKLTTKATPFEWNTECIEAFTALKDVISYASRSLSSPEWQYSAIQESVLQYFSPSNNSDTTCWEDTSITDHAPLQWLSTQKMEGMPCRWALALQEYDFEIEFRKGKQNANADALSCRYSPCALIQVESHLLSMKSSQLGEKAPFCHKCCKPASNQGLTCVQNGDNILWDDIDNTGHNWEWLMAFSVENIPSVLLPKQLWCLFFLQVFTTQPYRNAMMLLALVTWEQRKLSNDSALWCTGWECQVMLSSIAKSATHVKEQNLLILSAHHL